jgi:hypothetical protein
MVLSRCSPGSLPCWRLRLIKRVSRLFKGHFGNTNPCRVDARSQHRHQDRHTRTVLTRVSTDTRTDTLECCNGCAASRPATVIAATLTDVIPLLCCALQSCQSRQNADPAVSSGAWLAALPHSQWPYQNKGKQSDTRPFEACVYCQISQPGAQYQHQGLGHHNPCHQAKVWPPGPPAVTAATLPAPSLRCFTAAR